MGEKDGMMKEVFIETYKYMWRNKKNRLFMTIAFVFIILYILFILPNLAGSNEVDIEALERDMYANQQQFEDRLNNGMTVPSLLTGTNAYYLARNEYANQRELLTALRQGDVYRYLAIPYRPSSREELTDNTFGNLDFPILGTEIDEAHQVAKNTYYLNEVENLSFHTVHNRTSIQQLHLFFIGLGPVVLLLSLIFLISDVLAKDRYLKTQKAGVPLKWPVYIFVQSMAALSFVVLFFTAITILFVLLNGLLHGFGTVDLPVGYYRAYFDEGILNQANYTIESAGWFFTTTAPFVFLLFYLMTRLNALFSLIVKHPIVVMVLGMFVVSFQNFYYAEETSHLMGIHLTWFPQTYINFGEVVTGRLEHQLLETIPTIVSRGLLVLAASILVVEILLYLTSKKISRQKFLL